MMRRPLAIGILCLGLTRAADGRCDASQEPAAQPEPAEQPRDDAKTARPPTADQLRARGAEHFAREKWLAAVEAFRAAYELEPRPRFLYDWAQAERLSGDCPTALELYRRFLQSGPKPAHERLALENMKRCSATLDDEAAQREPESASAMTDAPPSSTAPPSPTPAIPPDPSPPTLNASPPTGGSPVARSEPCRLCDPVGGVLVGTGVAVAGAGTVLWLMAAGNEDRAERAERGQSEDTYGEHAARIGRAERERAAAVGAFAAAGSLVVAGVLRYVLHDTGGAPRVGAWVSPTPSGITGGSSF